MKHLSLIASIFAAIIGIGVCSASATPRCQPCPYSCDDLGLGKKDCSFVSESRGVCCVDLTKKGIFMAEEQERALASRKVASSCPSGFKPSERSCSQDERKRGCRDQRVGPERMGCVSSQFR